jgi:hypothetical protein
MQTANDIPPDRWREVGPFAVCETLAELFVAVRTVLGLEGVERLLVDNRDENTRESLRRAANEIALVGLADLAALVRRAPRARRHAEQ